jgi:hypothetical protein
MNHPRARALRFLAFAALSALSACSTTPSTQSTAVPSAEAPLASAAVPSAAPAQAACSLEGSPALTDASHGPRGRVYFVLGAVATEGAQSFDGDLTVFEAITRAQPRKDSANLGRVRLIRADPRDPYEWTIDLRRMIETGDSSQNLHVQERDVLYVPAAEPVEPK